MEKVGSFRKNNAMTFVAIFLTWKNEKKTLNQMILCINHSNTFKDCKYKNVMCRTIWNKETNKSIRKNKTKLLQWIGHKVQGHKEKCVGHMHFQTISL
jgi:hypothetical protein